MKNRNESQKLLDIIFQLLIQEQSEEAFYHVSYQEINLVQDIGFFCFFKISFLMYLLALNDKNVDPDIFAIHIRSRILYIMDQVDVKLCEKQYEIITSFIFQDTEFPKFINKLDIWEVVCKHHGLLMSHEVIQKKIAIVIIEGGFK